MFKLINFANEFHRKFQMFFVFSGVIWMMVSVLVVCMEVPARLSLENKHGKLWCQAYL